MIIRSGRIALLMCCPALILTLAGADEARLHQFESDLDSLRQQYRIPGLSAAIVRNQQIIWEQGYGFSDVANRVPARPETPYLVASLTKTFTSMLLMRCVERGTLNLDDPMIKYSRAIPEPNVTVRHVFTHTSESRPPGQTYKYNGNRFAALGAVVDVCAETPYRLAVTKSILDPLGLRDSMPGKDTGNPSMSLAANFTAEQLSQYAGTLQRLAKPYRIDSRGQPILAAYPQEDVNASAGIISTVRDLAKYDAAIDRHILLQPQTQQLAWTNPLNNVGQALPYALGWFVQRYAGQTLVWHYGQWDTFSALILKIPERQLTLLLLANSDGLSGPFAGLGGRGDVTSSAFANLFLRMLLEPGVLDARAPAIQSGGVVNAASFLPTISPGAWATVFGQNFSNIPAPGRSWRGDEIVNGLLPTSLEDVTVHVFGKRAALSFVGPGQINFQVPDDVPRGPVQIEVAGPNGLSETVAFVQPVAPALFTIRSTPQDIVAALHADGTPVAKPDQVSGGTPARNDEIIAIYGTGFGLTNPPQPSGWIVQVAPLAAPFLVRIGGLIATAEYGGLVSPGLYQFNVRVPPNLSGEQPVWIELGETKTQIGILLVLR